MGGILTFPAEGVRELIEHAKQCKTWRANYSDLFEPSYHKGGVVLRADGQPAEKDDWPDDNNIDGTKIGPKLWLVGDQGVYLMSNGFPQLPGRGSSNKVVYANECDPTNTFCDWHNNKRSIFGGDDGVESIEIDGLERVLADGATVLRIQLTEKSLEILMPEKPKAVGRRPGRA